MKGNLILISAFAVCTQAHAFGFDQIEYWLGQGSQQAGVVIQWDTNDQPQALAWGFRFDGTLTAADAWDALQGDARLFRYEQTFSFGRAIYGIGYDRDNDQIKGYTNPGPTPDNAVANDPDDAWEVGWLSNGYWSLWEANGASATSFTAANTGISGLSLEDQDWVLLAFAPAASGWSTTPPTRIAAAPVPEPATLLALSVGLLALRRRRR